MSLKRPVVHCLVIRQMGSLSYTFPAGIGLVVCRLTRYMLESVRSFGGWGVSLTRSVLESVRSFVGLGVCLTRPLLESVSLVGRTIVSLTRPLAESAKSFGT